jgi:phage/plasmid primase-like uncharacterized protein
MIAADLIQRAKATRLEDELARRGIVMKGRAERSGPCPRCGGVDRFGINTRKQIWNCRGCGVGGDVIALVRHIDGSTFTEAVAVLTGDPHRDQPPRRDPDQRRDQQLEDEARRLEIAHRLFDQTDPLGPEAIAYLEGRKIDINAVPELGGLRFHPRCPWEDGQRPTVLARYTDAITSTPRGIWRRPITGEKPKALGPTAGCVIRLWPGDWVTTGLVLGEGVETTLAAATRIEHRGTLLQPAWSTGSAGNMASFPVLAGIEALTVLVDHDVNVAGQTAAKECAIRWSSAGRDVELLTPKIPDTDFNDVVRGRP